MFINLNINIFVYCAEAKFITLKNIMVESNNLELLGQTLQKAGLVSFPQIQVALADLEYSQHLRIGEVLSVRGWIAQQTADFFAEEWYPLIDQAERYPIGYYLVKSGLLTGEETYSILEEQKRIWIKFGSIAILRGLLAEQTLNYFLDNLVPGTSSKPPAIGAIGAIEKEIEIEDQHIAPEIDYEDIPWID